MNLFELNARLAVKLNQSFDTLYNLEFMEYSLLLNIVNRDIEVNNEKIKAINDLNDGSNSQVKVNLPTHLKSR